MLHNGSNFKFASSHDAFQDHECPNAQEQAENTSENGQLVSTLVPRGKRRMRRFANHAAAAAIAVVLAPALTSAASSGALVCDAINVCNFEVRLSLQRVLPKTLICRVTPTLRTRTGL